MRDLVPGPGLVLPLILLPLPPRVQLQQDLHGPAASPAPTLPSSKGVGLAGVDEGPLARCLEQQGPAGVLLAVTAFSVLAELCCLHSTHMRRRGCNQGLLCPQDLPCELWLAHLRPRVWHLHDFCAYVPCSGGAAP